EVQSEEGGEDPEPVHHLQGRQDALLVEGELQLGAEARAADARAEALLDHGPRLGGGVARELERETSGQARAAEYARRVLDEGQRVQDAQLAPDQVGAPVERVEDGGRAGVQPY